MVDNKDQPGGKYFSDLFQIAKGAGVTFSGTVSGKALLLFYTIFLAKVLGAGDLGLYFLGVTVVRLLTITASLGLGAGVVRYVAIYRGRDDICRMKGTVLISAALTIVTSLLLVGLVFLVGDFVATSILHKPELGTVIKLLSLSIPFESLMRIFLASTRGLKLMQYVVYTENLTWVGLRFLFAIFFIFVLGWGLKGVVLAYVASSIFAAGLALYYTNKYIPLLDKKTIPLFEIKNLLGFSLPMVFTVMFHDLMTRVDILMLGLFVSATEIGIYSIAVRILALAQVIFMVFQPIFQPFVAELHTRREFERLSNLLKSVTSWSVTLSFPVFLSLFSFPGFFLQIFGKEFDRGAACLSVLAIAYILSSISNLPSSMIFMSGRSDITLKNNLAVLIINTALNYLLIPRYGILGAACATGTSLVFLSVIRITEIYFLMKISPFKIELWKPLSAGLVSFSVVMFICKNIAADGITIVISLLSLLFVLYSLLMYLFRVNEEDLYMKEVIKKKLLSFSKSGAGT